MLRKPTEIDILARRIMEQEVFCPADLLVEYLLEESNKLDAIQKVSNRFYCPVCECMSKDCSATDSDHEMEIISTEAWFQITEKLAFDLEYIGEMVLQLNDLGVYFWGRSDRISGNHLDNDIFRTIATARLKRSI